MGTLILFLAPAAPRLGWPSHCSLRARNRIARTKITVRRPECTVSMREFEAKGPRSQYDLTNKSWPAPTRHPTILYGFALGIFANIQFSGSPHPNGQATKPTI